MIDTLFPDGVVTVEATPEMWSGALHPREAALLPAGAADKRRREFTAGRVCARAALARLGVADFPLLAGPQRAPIWPKGFVGSLSHCGDYCGVAIARRDRVGGLGLDVERARPLRDRIVSFICTGTERARLASLPGGAAEPWAAVIFAAKESVYKCHHPLAGTSLDFHDVEIRLDPKRGTFMATIGMARAADGSRVPPPIAEIHGRFARSDRYVFAGVSVPAR